MKLTPTSRSGKPIRASLFYLAVVALALFATARPWGGRVVAVE